MQPPARRGLTGEPGVPPCLLGEHDEPPPEPGFARREAHYEKKPPSQRFKGRLLKPTFQATARKEGAHGGTRGSPVPKPGVPPCSRPRPQPPRAARRSRRASPSGSGGTGRGRSARP